jgi:hypothetical protein
VGVVIFKIIDDVIIRRRKAVNISKVLKYLKTKLTCSRIFLEINTYSFIEFIHLFIMQCISCLFSTSPDDCKDCEICEFFIDGCLNQAKYHALLSNEISNFLDEMPLAVLNRIVFHQDGATPHNARINVAFLNDNFGARWMGTYGPIRWPARSPDLNPLDFFLWGYIRDNVYLTPPGTRE